MVTAKAIEAGTAETAPAPCVARKRGPKASPNPNLQHPMEGVMPDTLDLGRLEKLLREEAKNWISGPVVAEAADAIRDAASRISELESALRQVKAEAIGIAKASAKRCTYNGSNPYLAACLKHRRADARRIAREIEAIDLDAQARNVLGEKA